MFRGALVALSVVALAVAEDPMHVGIGKDGAYLVEGKSVENKEMEVALLERGAKSKEGEVSSLVVEVTSDGGAPSVSVSALLMTGARHGVWQFRLVVDGKTVPIELPKDIGIAIEQPKEGAGGAVFMMETYIPVGLCSTGDLVGHSGERPEHFQACFSVAVAERTWCWVGDPPERADEAIAGKDSYAAVAKAAKEQVEAEAKESGGAALANVEVDPNVAVRELHALLSALTDGQVPFSLEAPPQ